MPVPWLAFLHLSWPVLTPVPVCAGGGGVGRGLAAGPGWHRQASVQGLRIEGSARPHQAPEGPLGNRDMAPDRSRRPV